MVFILMVLSLDMPIKSSTIGPHSHLALSLLSLKFKHWKLNLKKMDLFEMYPNSDQQSQQIGVPESNTLMVCTTPHNSQKLPMFFLASKKSWQKGAVTCRVPCASTGRASKTPQALVSVLQNYCATKKTSAICSPAPAKHASLRTPFR